MRFFHKLTSFSQIFVRIISLFLPIITNSVCILRRHTAGFLRGFEKNRKILVFLGLTVIRNEITYQLLADGFRVHTKLPSDS